MKQLADKALGLLLLPLRMLYMADLLAYDTVTQAIGFIPGRVGVGIRRAWYRRTLTRCGDHLVVDFLSAIRTPKTSVGDRCYIGRANWIGYADIGDGLLSGNSVTIHSGPHQHGFARTDIPMRLQPGKLEKVVIGRDVWIGSHVVVNTDVAEGTIVASGAVVTKQFSPFSIIGGVPARLIRSRLQAEVERDLVQET
jgi:acetyltransferase-like isoleucine patch superfamily enzyme